MPVRTSEARWRGGVRDGEGELALGSGAWRGPYSFRSRFREEESTQSNPEELVAAGHAGCFSMALANRLEQAGFPPEEIHTTADCHLEMDDDAGPTITRIELETDVAVPDIGTDRLRELASEARDGCPVSRALAGVEITLDLSRSE